jgi:hypothetical protein
MHHRLVTAQQHLSREALATSFNATLEFLGSMTLQMAIQLDLVDEDLLAVIIRTMEWSWARTS